MKLLLNLLVLVFDGYISAAKSSPGSALTPLIGTQDAPMYLIPSEWLVDFFVQGGPIKRYSRRGRVAVRVAPAVLATSNTSACTAGVKIVYYRD